ncbi:4-hydroxy-tetrahydrodipicolinate synthase [Romboutsia sedimentorum]|jgi:4-hydroxy-tetrahydrodipicolinate synthase|uniref:4-hydroxy-tetrahydrodipicolinate synthase n=1 Tax=Romboutsia sedimentorum TaxID=1368474 RepID=A0ABT7EBA0_9FIRM|nr:4-hydroxy-tetrahydrodipicolinate synthase [Romboutsia sedimentorum]MDK2564210.1 4-hydroxy-tetrahydrodipicolinate synthase [Romboutsia sedimentorum]MDK2586827.1 4-hydroxy-tetrahydrodipicolinate synthase [Romboutsia sedimentorum]
MSLFEGCGVALVTPFKNNEVDYEKLKEIINWHIDNKTDAIVICGTTGESATMTDKERKSVIKFTVETVNNRIPVIAGSGSNNTAYSVELSKYCEEVGVDGLLVVTPYYNKATELGLIKHYECIANSVNLPIILYNVPGRTGVNISPKTVKKLSTIKNIIAIKEASGDISQVAEIARLCKDDIDIYSGNDDMVVPILSLGGKGVISVVANILPRDTHNMVETYLNGDLLNSRKLQLDMNGLINSLFIEVNPIPVKTAMNLMGMDVGELRLPLTNMTDDNLKILIEEMNMYGIKTEEK